MEKECKDDSCCITKEEYKNLDYKSKYLLAMMLLRLEEEENSMLRTLLDELKKANNPFRYYGRIFKIRLRIIGKKISARFNRASFT